MLPSSPPRRGGEPARHSDPSQRAEAAQAYIGRTATASLGMELLRVTKSRELRWVAPGMVVTMDYRTGRLTVSYDQAMRITTISCG